MCSASSGAVGVIPGEHGVSTKWKSVGACCGLCCFGFSSFF